MTDAAASSASGAGAASAAAAAAEAAAVARFAFTREALRKLFEQAEAASVDAWGGVPRIADGLRSTLDRGLCGDELEVAALADRVTAFTTNTTPPAPHKSLFELFWESFEDTTLIILIISAVVSIVLGTIFEHDGEAGWVEGVAILAAVLIVATVTAVNDYQKERQFRKLNDVKNNKPVKVIRDGEKIEISIYEVLCGDLVHLDPGDAVPADGLFVEGHDLKTDESAMTGETNEIKKDARHPFLLSGCVVSGGRGTMLVTGVGVWSEWGLTLSKLREDSEETPLQVKLTGIATMIGKMGLVFAILTFVGLLLNFIYLRVTNPPFVPTSLLDIIQYFILAVTVLVVAVPEGLPLAVTIALAYSMKKMMREHNLVRHLEACETMGGATNICSDKTGTLTENRMSVVQGYFAGKVFETVPKLADLHPEYAQLLTDGLSLNGTAFLQEKAPVGMPGAGAAVKPAAGASPTPSHAHAQHHHHHAHEVDSAALEQHDDEVAAAKAASEIAHHPLERLMSAAKPPHVDLMKLDKNQIKVVGSKTEGALLFMARDLGVNYESVRSDFPLHKLWNFDSDKKRMSVIVRRRNGPGFRLHCKGAAESVLADCRMIRTGADDDVAPLSDATRAELSAALVGMARCGLRTLTLAYRDFAHDEGWEEEKPAPDDEQLVFYGMVGIKDPVRPEVPGAVATCRRAGIVVRMVTGDNLETASYIARECRILESENDVAMVGPVFRNLPVPELDAALKTLRVLARSSPSDKHLLVSRLRELGEVVAVTGDGTNDAPALKVADVGFSMGIAGTEVAKEASDIVILNDNFESIVSAVKWGRGVYDSIRKFLQFQLTVNVVALILAFIGAVSQRGQPLNPVQLLWVNLIMDTLAALALATETPTMALLNRKPYGRHDRLISATMWRNIVMQSIYQLAVLFGTLYLGSYAFAVVDQSRTHYTMIFNIFVFMQLFNEINSRKVNNEQNVFAGMHRSPIFIVVLLVTLGLQILIVTFGGSFTRTEALSIYNWLICIGVGAFSIPLGFIVRIMPPFPIKPATPPPPPRLNVDDHNSDSSTTGTSRLSQFTDSDEEEIANALAEMGDSPPLHASVAHYEPISS